MTQNYKKLYEDLLEEHVHIKNELKETKKILATYIGEEKSCYAPESTQKTSKERIEIAEFISIFLSLFRGRPDVYAKYFVNDKSGKRGFAPQRIYDSVNRRPHKDKFKLLTADMILKHFQGKDPRRCDVIGVYPILEDETCYFLAIDFDKEKWQEEVTAFRKTCEAYNLPIYVERSQSGNGAHVWFFFSEKNSDKISTKAGNTLINRDNADLPSTELSFL